MRKTILLFVVLASFAQGVWAGDSARFLNLGFSNDSRYFMFGEYGITNGASLSFAEYSIIDVARNDFVPKGRLSERFSTRQEAGNDGLGAMLTLVGRDYSRVKNYGINHLLTGRIVYVLIDGQVPISSLEFRDFNNASLYQVKLNQENRGTGAAVSSCFWIEVDVTDASGKTASHKIGRPEFFRKGVREYRIKYLLLAPDGASLIFVLEKSVVDAEGESIRYMVETKKIGR